MNQCEERDMGVEASAAMPRVSFEETELRGPHTGRVPGHWLSALFLEPLKWEIPPFLCSRIQTHKGTADFLPVRWS